MLVTNNWFLIPFSTVVALILMGGLFAGFVITDEIRFSQNWWRIQLAYPIFLHTIAIFSVTAIFLVLGKAVLQPILWSAGIILVLNIFPIVHQFAGLREGEILESKDATVERYSGTKYSQSTSKYRYKVAVLKNTEKRLRMPIDDWLIAYHDCGNQTPFRIAGLPVKDRLVRWQCTTDSPWRDATMVTACEPECKKPD